MLKRIELTNFMSHAHTVIEPAAGLTVLVGPNNCGKSALVAALQILCHNENSTYVMRHGARECSVEVQTDDGHTVRWTRKGAPSYLIDGQAFDRLRNAGVPEQLHSVLRLPKVDAGDETSFDIHFGCQKSPIFLLDSPKSAAAKFFGASSDASRLLEIQRRHREKLAEKQREKTRLEAESKRLNAELEALQPAVDLDHRLKFCEEAHQLLAQLAAAMEQLDRENTTLERQLTDFCHYRAQTEAIGPLAVPPVLTPIEPISALMEQLQQADGQLHKARDRVKCLHFLNQPPQLAETRTLDQLVENRVAIEDAIHRAEEESKALAALAAVPTVHGTADLTALIARLNETVQIVSVETGRGTVLDAVTSPPLLAEEMSVAKLADELAAAEAQLSRARALITTLDSLSALSPLEPTQAIEQLVAAFDLAAKQTFEMHSRLAEIDEQLAAVASELREVAGNSVCPTCGAPFDPDRLLADSLRGCAHE